MYAIELFKEGEREPDVVLYQSKVNIAVSKLNEGFEIVWQFDDEGAVFDGYRILPEDEEWVMEEGYVGED